uniref:Uncharacterized protein n=1 Tax=Solanum lycopersicum TaxID=4081 RepID=A0A3Q7GJY4_SOLLC
MKSADPPITPPIPTPTPIIPIQCHRETTIFLHHQKFDKYQDNKKANFNFKPAEETSIVPVGILIHQLSWHLFDWQIVSRLIGHIGRAVAPDQVTYSKSRGNVAKVKVEID